MVNRPEGVVLLRTLTRKSLIGFGAFVDLTVQNLLDTFRSRELLHIYYTCRNIDFNQDLKDELCISGEREINKKNNKNERYINETFLYISVCTKLMLDKQDNVMDNKNQLQFIKFNRFNKKNKENSTTRKERYFNSKINNRNRNQKH